jgi:uncharacterized membrane protein YczE
MADYFTIIICLIIGFFAGRFYPIVLKFKKYLEEQSKEKKI